MRHGLSCLKLPSLKRVRATCPIEQKTPKRILGQYGASVVHRISRQGSAQGVLASLKVSKDGPSSLCGGLCDVMTKSARSENSMFNSSNFRFFRIALKIVSFTSWKLFPYLQLTSISVIVLSKKYSSSLSRSLSVSNASANSAITMRQQTLQLQE